MAFSDDPAYEYALRLSTPMDEVLQGLYRETYLQTAYPNMLSGPMQGKLLEMVSHMIRPARILEIGTFTGYSAICLARGLADGGVMHTIDVNEETIILARRYFSLAGLSERIVIHIGDAREIVPALDETFDLVFIDADKSQYLQYYHAVYGKLRTGGFLLADNVLWGGKVLHGAKYRDKETRGIQEFNTFVSADPRMEVLLLPVRDGLFIMRKLSG